MRPYQSEDPSPTLPTYRGKEEKWEIVEYKKGESNLANKKALDLLLKPANPTPSNTGSTRSFQRETERGIKVLRYYEVLTKPQKPFIAMSNLSWNTRQDFLKIPSL